MKKLKMHAKWAYLRYKNRMKNSYGGKRELNDNEKSQPGILNTVYVSESVV